MNNTSPVSCPCTRLASTGVFLFFALMFAIPSGYAWGGALLLLAGLWLLAKKEIPIFERADRVMLATLLAYALVTIAMTLWLGNKHSDIDRASRALMVMPVLLLLLRVPVRLALLWAGVILGAILACALAWWQTEIQGVRRPMGFQDVIGFSNVALVFAAFCAAGLRWIKTQRRYTTAWRIALSLGMLCSLYAAMISGSRGSWVAFPVIVAVFAIALLSRRNLRYAVLCVIALGCVIVVLFNTPDSALRTRYQDGLRDITQYQQNKTDTSIGARFELWRAAIINLQQRPVWGWNVADYRHALENLVQQGRVTKPVLRYPDNVHNNYLDAWVFLGLPGLLGVLLLYGVPLWHFGRYLRDNKPAVQAIALCGATLSTSYWCFSLTQVVLGHHSTTLFYLMSLVICWGALRHARATPAYAA